jgi:hypothetical protein
MQESPIDKWVFHKKGKGDIDFYLRPKQPSYVSYRFTLEVDFPPQLVTDQLGKLDQRLKWDDGYEILKMVRDWEKPPSMVTQILYVKLKTVFLLGQREVMFLCQGYQDPQSGIIYLGNSSTEHPEHPINEKIIRINSLAAHWILEPLDGGKRTRLTNISELQFGGNVPKSLVQTSASER